MGPAAGGIVGSPNNLQESETPCIIKIGRIERVVWHALRYSEGRACCRCAHHALRSTSGRATRRVVWGAQRRDHHDARKLDTRGACGEIATLIHVRPSSSHRSPDRLHSEVHHVALVRINKLQAQVQVGAEASAGPRPQGDCPSRTRFPWTPSRANIHCATSPTWAAPATPSTSPPTSPW